MQYGEEEEKMYGNTFYMMGFIIEVFFMHFNAEKENYLRESISRTANVKFL